MKKVLIMDSGSGAVNILAECQKVGCGADFLVYCDNKNLPYGNKTKDNLICTTIQNLENIRTFFDYDIVVFACNTLTAVCIEFCREKFDDCIFIGVEPEIKPALKIFQPQKILVLATENTLKNNRSIICSDVQKVHLDWLAGEIDSNLDNLHAVSKKVTKSLLPLDFDAVVLGCTHYISLQKYLKQDFFDKKFFCGANGVANRLKSFLDNETKSKVQFIVTGDSQFLPVLYNFYQSILKEF